MITHAVRATSYPHFIPVCPACINGPVQHSHGSLYLSHGGMSRFRLPAHDVHNIKGSAPVGFLDGIQYDIIAAMTMPVRFRLPQA